MTTRKLHDKKHATSHKVRRHHATKKKARGVRINYIAVDVIGTLTPADEMDDGMIAGGTVNLPDEAVSGESADECTLRGM